MSGGFADRVIAVVVAVMAVMAKGPPPCGERALHRVRCVRVCEWCPARQRTGVPCGCCGAMPSAVVYLASASLPIAG